MSEGAEPPDTFDDTVVLSNEPPPDPRRNGGDGAEPRTRPRRRLALVLAVILVAVVAWVNRPRPDAPPIVSDSATERGSRTTPIYPGALGRLLFTVPENATASSVDAERVWIVSLDNGAVERGPLIPPVGTESGLPPEPPGYPPDRRFAMGPLGTPSGRYLAFLGDAPDRIAPGKVVYLLDVGSGRMPALPVAVGRADDFAWDPRDGSLLTVSKVGPDILVERLGRGGTTVIARRKDPAVIGSDFRLILSGPSIYVMTAPDQLEIVRSGSLQPVLTTWHPVVAGPNRHFVVANENPGVSGIREWRGEGPPTLLEGFQPGPILGQTPDRLRYATLGTFRGSYGVWLVEFPNLPVFELASIDPNGSRGVGDVTFDPDVRAAMFVIDFELRAVQIGSEESVTIPLTGPVAHRTPSGPVVWIP